jgi:hypothetical protein
MARTARSGRRRPSVMQTPVGVMQTPSKQPLLRKFAGLLATLAVRGSDLDNSS